MASISRGNLWNGIIGLDKSTSPLKLKNALTIVWDVIINSKTSNYDEDVESNTLWSLMKVYLQASATSYCQRGETPYSNLVLTGIPLRRNDCGFSHSTNRPVAHGNR